MPMGLNDTRTRVIVGSSSAIAQAFVDSLKQTTSDRLITVSSRCDADIHCDYTDDSIHEAITQIPEGPIDLHIFNGQLCLDQQMPEKRISELDYRYFNELMRINCWIPMQFIRLVTPRLMKKTPCDISVLSARVGSVDDNRLGGWYSYRASKAALNQMFKSASIEIIRRNPEAKFLAFHPGTTESPLSGPFQQNVPSNKLFSPEFVGSQLLKVLSSLEVKPEAQFIDWDNKPIRW
jgi:NAD(P)-dependent dehydrogenase (short-subunit alcohol dehydrogenase family)